MFRKAQVFCTGAQLTKYNIIHNKLDTSARWASRLHVCCGSNCKTFTDITTTTTRTNNSSSVGHCYNNRNNVIITTNTYNNNTISYSHYYNISLNDRSIASYISKRSICTSSNTYVHCIALTNKSIAQLYNSHSSGFNSNSNNGIICISRNNIYSSNNNYKTNSNNSNRNIKIAFTNNSSDISTNNNNRNEDTNNDNSSGISTSNNSRNEDTNNDNSSDISTSNNNRNEDTNNDNSSDISTSNNNRNEDTSTRTSSNTNNNNKRSKAKYASQQAQLRLDYDPDLGLDRPEYVYERGKYRTKLRLYVWGVAAYGALGRPSFVDPRERKQRPITRKMYPHRLEFGEYHRVVSVGCGYGFTVLAVSDGPGNPSCYGTGLNEDGQIGCHMKRNQPMKMLIKPCPIPLPLDKGERVLQVSCGRAHSLALTSSGRALAWGNNVYGQCGRRVVVDQDYAKQTIYTPITDLDGAITQVVCGQDTSFFLTSAGSVYSCGWSADGQTGRDTYDSQDTVGRVGGQLDGVNIIKVSTRADCVLALSDNGTVYGWGNNEYQQLSLATDATQLSVPRPLPMPASVGRIVDVQAVGTACFLLNDRGEVYSWGYGPLGRGPNAMFSPEPVIIPPTLLGANAITPDAKVVSLVGGVGAVGAVGSEGDLYTWGRNIGGGLGQGHERMQSYPLRVSLGGRVVQASCGVDHMAAIVKQL